MADAALKVPRLTARQYLELERDGTVRHEFVDGVAYMMAAGSRRHNAIAGTLYTGLRNLLLGHCRPYFSDVKVHVRTTDVEMYFYPDLVVTCSDLDADDYLVRHPWLIVEVLSPSTEDYDRGAKFAAYQLLPSLKEYVLIAQDRSAVEIFRRRTGWLAENYASGGTLVLESVGVELLVDDLYARAG